MTHTPGPWHTGGRLNAIIYAMDGYAVANALTHHGRHGEGELDANAKFIVRACNAHDDMLAALEQVLEFLAKCEREDVIDWQWFDAAYYAARAALAKARGE